MKEFSWSATGGQYSVQTPEYEGPLDLLLQLIERAELDITRIALAIVTDQFLAHMEALQHRSPDELSAFLVIAARLIQIKSEALLPRPPIRGEDEEDPAELLARQLQEYRQFKTVAAWLGDRDQKHLRTYLRLASAPKIEARLDLEGLGVADLAGAAENVIRRHQLRPPPQDVIKIPKITIREKIRMIVDRLRIRGRTTFGSLLRGAHTRVEIVLTFLAVLELVKRRQVAARQEEIFGEIEIAPTEDWDPSAEGYDLEFGE